MADALHNNRVVLTYEDYLSLPNDRNRYEILEGELFMTPAPSLKHQEVSRNLEFLLFSHIKTNNLGKIFYAPVDVILDESTIVQPDLAFISAGRDEVYSRRGIEGAPDLIVEIVSPGTLKFDRVSKCQIYARYGVKWYWIVNPDDRTLDEYELRENCYNLSGSYSGDMTFNPRLFPGLQMDLSEIWA
jgi:Uma2 family endonuclease